MSDRPIPTPLFSSLDYSLGPVRVGHKKLKKVHAYHNPFDKTRSKIVINLTPSINNDVEQETTGDDVSYKHFIKLDDGSWSVSRVIHFPKSKSGHGFNPEDHLNHVSVEHPESGRLNRYYVQWSHQTPVDEGYSLSGFELPITETKSFMSTYNPFYVEGQDQLVKTLKMLDVDEFLGARTLSMVRELKHTLCNDHEPLVPMLSLVEQFKHLSHNLYDVSIGFKVDDELLEFIR